MFPSSSFSPDINNHYTDTIIYSDLSLVLFVCNYNSNSLSLTFITLIIFPSSSYFSFLLSLLLQAALLILIHFMWFLYLYLQNIECVLAPGSQWLFSLSCSLVSAQWGGQLSPPGCFHHWPAAWEPGCTSGTFFEMLLSQPQLKLIPAILQHPEQYFRLILFFPSLLLRFCPKWPLKRLQRLMPCWETSHTQRKSCVHENNDMSDGWHLKKTEGDSDIGKHRFFALLYTQQLACPQQHYASSKRA